MNVLDLFVAVKLDDQASSELKNFGDKAKSALKTAGKVGAGMAIDQIIEFGQSALSTGTEFDAAMSQVAATGGKTMEQLNSEVLSTTTAYGEFNGTLRDFAKYMGSNTAFTATQSAEALNYMALAGYDAQTSIDMLPTVMNLAAAGSMDLGRASDILTDTQSALGLSLEETYILVDQMAAASANSNTSVEQLGEAFLTVGGTAKNLSGGTLEAATALGILANNGIKGSEGGTALRNIINALIPKSDEAAGYFDALGASFFDASGEMRPLNESFGELAVNMESLSTQEKIEAMSAMFNKFDLKSVSALLANTVEGVDKVSFALAGLAGQRDDSEEFWEGIGKSLYSTGHSFEEMEQVIYDTLDSSGMVTDETREKLYEYGLSAEQVDIIMDGLSGTVLNGESAWTQLEDNINASWYSMDSLRESMANSGIDFETAGTNLENLGVTSDELQTALDSCGGNADVFAQMLLAAADEGVNMDDIIGTMGGDLGGLQTAFDNTAGAAQQMADTQLDNLQGDLTILDSALDGLRISISDKVSPALRDFTQMGTTLVSGLTALVSGDSESADAAFATLGEQIDAAWSNIQSGIDEILPGLQEFFTNLPTNITTWVGELGTTLTTAGSGLLQGFFDGIGTVVPTVVEFFTSIPSTVITLIGNVAETLLDTGKNLLNGIFTGASGAIAEGSEFRTWLVGLPASILSFIGNTTGTLLSTGSDLLQGLMNGILEIAPNALNFFQSMPGILQEQLGSVETFLNGPGSDFINGFLDGVGQFVGNVTEFFAALPETLLGFLSTKGEIAGTLVGAGIDFLTGLFNGVGQAAPDIVNFFTTLPDTLLGLLGDLTTFLSEAGTTYLEGFFTGLGVSSEDVTSFFESLPQTLLDLLSSAGELASFLIGAGSDFLGGLFTGIGEALPDIVSFFTSLPGTALELLGNVASFLIDAGSSFLGGFFSGIGEAAPDIVSFFTSLPSTMLDLLGDLTTFLFDKGSEFLTGLADGAMNAGSTLGSWIGELPGTLLNIISNIPNFAAMLFDKGKEFLGGMLDGLKAMFDGSGESDNVQNFIKGIPDAILGFINSAANVGSFLLDIGKSFIEGFLSGIKESFGTSSADVDSVANFVFSIPEKILGFIGNVTQTLFDTGKDIIGGLLGGIEAIFGGDGINGETVVNFVLGIPGKILDTIATLDIPNMLVSAGADLIEGFKQGIEQFSLKQLLIDVFGDLAGPVCDVLGIESPSKVFEDIGENVMQGAEDGITGKESSLDGTLSTIASGLPANFADAYWSMHDMGWGLAESFETGMANKFNREVLPYLSGLGSTIYSYFGGGYYTLWYAGQNIMAGLGNSMVDYFNRIVANQLQSITNAIPSYKGPLDKDKNLLVDNGEAIMYGLLEGIREGSSAVYSELGNITSNIGNTNTASIASAGSTINMADAFRGANITFRNRDDMNEFSEMLADHISRQTLGRYNVA